MNFQEIRAEALKRGLRETVAPESRIWDKPPAPKVEETHEQHCGVCGRRLEFSYLRLALVDNDGETRLPRIACCTVRCLRKATPKYSDDGYTWRGPFERETPTRTRTTHA